MFAKRWKYNIKSTQRTQHVRKQCKVNINYLGGPRRWVIHERHAHTFQTLSSKESLPGTVPYVPTYFIACNVTCSEILCQKHTATTLYNSNMESLPGNVPAATTYIIACSVPRSEIRCPNTYCDFILKFQSSQRDCTKEKKEP